MSKTYTEKDLVPIGEPPMLVQDYLQAVTPRGRNENGDNNQVVRGSESNDSESFGEVIGDMDLKMNQILTPRPHSPSLSRSRSEGNPEELVQSNIRFAHANKFDSENLWISSRDSIGFASVLISLLFANPNRLPNGGNYTIESTEKLLAAVKRSEFPSDLEIRKLRRKVRKKNGEGTTFKGFKKTGACLILTKRGNRGFPTTFMLLYHHRVIVDFGFDSEKTKDFMKNIGRVVAWINQVLSKYDSLNDLWRTRLESIKKHLSVIFINGKDGRIVQPKTMMFSYIRFFLDTYWSDVQKVMENVTAEIKNEPNPLKFNNWKINKKNGTEKEKENICEVSMKKWFEILSRKIVSKSEEKVEDNGERKVRCDVRSFLNFPPIYLCFIIAYYFPVIDDERDEKRFITTENGELLRMMILQNSSKTGKKRRRDDPNVRANHIRRDNSHDHVHSAPRIDHQEEVHQAQNNGFQEGGSNHQNMVSQSSLPPPPPPPQRRTSHVTVQHEQQQSEEEEEIDHLRDIRDLFPASDESMDIFDSFFDEFETMNTLD